MPMSPNDAASLTPGERMIAIQTISQIDHELTQRYDDSGTFTIQITRVNGMSEKVASDIIKQYRMAGWRGSRYYYSTDCRQVVFYLSVKEHE